MLQMLDTKQTLGRRRPCSEVLKLSIEIVTKLIYHHDLMSEDDYVENRNQKQRCKKVQPALPRRAVTTDHHRGRLEGAVPHPRRPRFFRSREPVAACLRVRGEPPLSGRGA